MTVVRGVGTFVLSAAIVTAIVALSQVPVPLTDVDGALLRLSWRVGGVRIEECRTLTAEELEAVPAHMRRSEECTGRNAEYLLHVEVDSDIAVHDTIRPAGARGDRPLYVFRELRVPAGPRAVRVSFDALVPSDFDAGDEPLGYEWTGSLTLDPAEIALVTIDAATASLVRVRPDA